MLALAALAAGMAVVGCGGGGSSSGTGGKGGSPAGTGGKSSSGTGGNSGPSGTGGQPAAGTGGSSTGGPDAGATGGAGTAADGGVSGGDLGKACAAAADCGGGLICLLPTDKLIFGQGGPANGYCTLPCAAEADAVKCEANSGTCVDLRVREADPPQGYCLLNCTVGAEGVGTKCRTRPDVACTSLNADPDAGVVPDVCLPTCSQDIDCPASRKCDDLLGVCVDTKTAGDPMGAHCTYDSTGTKPDTCAGLCLPLGDGSRLLASYCTRRCVFGALDGCNFAEKASSLTTGGPHAVCVIADDTAGVGDQGFCVEQCDTVSQCSNKADPGAVCDTSVPELGHGFCNWPPTSNVDAGTGG